MILYTTYVFVLLVCVSPVSSNGICNGSNDVEWKSDPSDCTVFYLCFGTLQHKYNCEKDTVYNEEVQKCVAKGSKQDLCSRKHNSQVNASPEDQCQQSKSIFLTYEESCSKYIDCSLNSVQECPYPLLFDEDSKRCIQPDRANCGSRTIYVDPCDYEENHCRSSMGCVPCRVRYPSCKGLPNGLNPWVGREGSPYYAVCSNERVVYQDMCDFEKKREIFHPQKRACEAIYE